MNSWSSQWLYMPAEERAIRMFRIRSFFLYMAHFCWTVSAGRLDQPGTSGSE